MYMETNIAGPKKGQILQMSEEVILKVTSRMAWFFNRLWLNLTHVDQQCPSTHSTLVRDTSEVAEG